MHMKKILFSAIFIALAAIPGAQSRAEYKLKPSIVCPGGCIAPLQCLAPWGIPVCMDPALLPYSYAPIAQPAPSMAAVPPVGIVSGATRALSDFITALAAPGNNPLYPALAPAADTATRQYQPLTTLDILKMQAVVRGIQRARGVTKPWVPASKPQQGASMPAGAGGNGSSSAGCRTNDDCSRSSSGPLCCIVGPVTEKSVGRCAKYSCR